MAAISVTVANVRTANERSRPTAYEASEAVAAGEPVHLEASTNKVKPANALTATNCVGLAMTNAAADGDFVFVQETLEVDAGATLVKGELYYVGTLAGEIIPHADLAASDVIVALYRATTTTQATMELNLTGITL